MKLTVTVHGLEAGIDLFSRALNELPAAKLKAEEAFANKVKDRFTKAAMSGGYGQAKKGNPALYDSGKYVNSWQVQRQDGGVTLGPTGMNDHMSNEALGELLEWGSGSVAAIPHLRPLQLYVHDNYASEVGQAILTMLFGK